MDSRAYLFIFPVNAPADIPEDFRSCVEGRSFEQGVFLPQDDTNWFMRPPEYPARLLLLAGCCLLIVPHPASGQNVIELNLDDIVPLETGNSLLLGWIQFSTRLSTCRLIYNTRASQTLDRFMAAMRRRWLGAPAAKEPSEINGLDPKLDVKFRNLLDDALDRDESVLSQCFTPPLEYQNKFMLLRTRKWRPGHLLALTSGNRLLWLKDEYRGHWERYAGITVSAPVSLFLRCTLETSPDHCDLAIHFVAGNSWRIVIYQPDSNCAEFSKTLNGRVAPASRNRYSIADTMRL